MVKYKRPEVVFEALSSAPRRKIVEALSRTSAASVSALAKPLNMSLPGALKHIRILEDAGIVSCEKEGRISYCSINGKALESGIEWLLAQKQFWDKSFSRLERHLKK